MASSSQTSKPANSVVECRRPLGLKPASYFPVSIPAYAFPSQFGMPLLCQRRQPSYLSMGLLDDIGSFLTNREDDFVKLDSTDDAFGPGPVILLYGCPDGLSDQELKDMISDGAPKATKASGGGVPFCRIGREASGDQRILESCVSEALELVANGEYKEEEQATKDSKPASACPVIYFSGFTNAEMMETYGIIAREIYEETGGFADAACAKAVPPAMGKPLKQVFDEITGDHLDALDSLNNDN